MKGPLQKTGGSLASRSRPIVIIAFAAYSILVTDCAQSGTPRTANEAATTQPAEQGPCHGDARYVAPSDGATGLTWRSVRCTRREAGTVCEVCPTCGSDAWCALVKTRGLGPRGPGGGPDE
jgi:hypothetical protein